MQQMYTSVFVIQNDTDVTSMVQVHEKEAGTSSGKIYYVAL